MADGGGSGQLGGRGQQGALPGRTLGGIRGFGPLQNLLLVLALIGGGLGGYWGFTHFYESANKPPAVGQPIRVTRTTIRKTVSATGTVAAPEQASLTFQTTGQITQVRVKPGDQVQQGETIATLDNRSATIARDQARSNLASAQAKLDALLAGATPDVVEAARQAVVQAQTGVQTAQNNITTSQSNVTTAQDTLQKANNDLASLLNGATPTAIQQAQASVDAAATTLQLAQANYDKLVSHADLATRSETTTLATARQNFQTAQATYLGRLTPPLALNVSQAQTNVKLAQDALQAAESRNLQVQADPTSSIADKQAAQNQVTSAAAAIDAAQSSLQLLLQGTDQSDIAAAQSQLDNARVALQAAQTNYNNLVALSDLATRPETSALASAQSQLETARANFANVTAPPQQTDISSAQAAVGAAQASLQSAQAGLQSSQASVPNAQSALTAAQAKLTQTVGPPLPTDVTQATEAVNSAQLALQNAQLALDNETLVAPFAGTIISVPATVGSQVGTTTAIATLVNAKALEVDANVDETSVTQLRVGQTATVTLDALPGVSYNATVAAVTPSGTTQQGVVVFPIVFTIDTQGKAVPPAGASANITVTTATYPNVIAVPARYIHKVGADNVVDVLVNNKRESRVVQIAVGPDGQVETNGQQTAIASGLQVGDVAIPPQQTRQGATFGAAPGSP